MPKQDAPVKKNIRTLALALVACAALYAVGAAEELRAGAAVAPAPSPTATATPAAFGVREPDFLLALHGRGLSLRVRDAALGEYALAAGRNSPAYPLVVSLSAEGRVNGFVMTLPAVAQPEDVNPESAIGQALMLRGIRGREAERAAVNALLPALLDTAAPPGAISAGVRARWLDMALAARERGGEQEDAHAGCLFRARVNADQTLAVSLDL